MAMPVPCEKVFVEPSGEERNKMLVGNVDELTEQVEQALKKLKGLEEFHE